MMKATKRNQWASAVLVLMMVIGTLCAVLPHLAIPSHAETFGGDTTTLELVTDISSLATDDKVVIATEALNSGLTGWNGSKDATVSSSASDWVIYTVTTTSGGVYLKDTEANKEIASPGSSNQFKYGTKAVCTVDANGYLTCNSRILYKNGTYYRMYASKAGDSAYVPFCVFKVVEAVSDCDHNWGAGEVTTPTTCTTDGVRTYTCSLCGDTKTETIKTPGHDYSTPVVTTPADCTNPGEQTSTCSVCGNEKVEPINPTGHNYVDGECSVCGVAQPNEISVTIDFTAQGYTNGQTVTSFTADRVALNFTNGGTATAYYNTGTAVRLYYGSKMTVTADGYQITNIVITFGSGDGSNAITANCGTYASGTWEGESDVVTFTVGGTSGHRRLKTLTVTYAVPGSTECEHTNYSSDVTPPSCTEDGYTTHTCLDCEYYTWEDTPVAATGHNLVDNVCTKCGVKLYDVIGVNNVANLKAGDTVAFTIVVNGTAYIMHADDATSKAPLAGTTHSDIVDKTDWFVVEIVVVDDNTYYMFRQYGTANYLYCNDANNGVRVGDSYKDENQKHFTVQNSYLYNVGFSRYLGVYNTADWRCYETTTGNIAGQAFSFALIPHTHAHSQYVSDGNDTHTSLCECGYAMSSEAHNHVGHVCEDCGHYEFAIAQVSLTLTESIAMNFKMLAGVGETYTNISATFYFTDRSGKVIEYTTNATEKDGYLVFTYPELSPKNAVDDVKIVVTADGENTCEKTFSIRAYCEGMLEQGKGDAKLEAALIALLDYCAAAQIYDDYKTDDLANKNVANFADATKPTEATKDNTENSLGVTAKVDAPEAAFKSVGLSIADNVSVRFKVNVALVEGMYVEFVMGENTHTTTTFEEVGEDTYYVYFANIAPTDLETVFTATVKNAEGVAVSHTIQYSVASYAHGNQASANETLESFMFAMLTYGKAVKNYAE